MSDKCSECSDECWWVDNDEIRKEAISEILLETELRIIDEENRELLIRFLCYLAATSAIGL